MYNQESTREPLNINNVPCICKALLLHLHFTLTIVIASRRDSVPSSACTFPIIVMHVSHVVEYYAWTKHSWRETQCFLSLRFAKSCISLHHAADSYAAWWAIANLRSIDWICKGWNKHISTCCFFILTAPMCSIFLFFWSAHSAMPRPSTSGQGK